MFGLNDFLGDQLILIFSCVSVLRFLIYCPFTRSHIALLSALNVCVVESSNPDWCTHWTVRCGRRGVLILEITQSWDTDTRVFIRSEISINLLALFRMGRIAGAMGLSSVQVYSYTELSRIEYLNIYWKFYKTKHFKDFCLYGVGTFYRKSFHRRIHFIDRGSLI